MRLLAVFSVSRWQQFSGSPQGEFTTVAGGVVGVSLGACDRSGGFAVTEGWCWELKWSSWRLTGDSGVFVKGLLGVHGPSTGVRCCISPLHGVVAPVRRQHRLSPGVVRKE